MKVFKSLYYATRSGKSNICIVTDFIWGANSSKYQIPCKDSKSQTHDAPGWTYGWRTKWSGWEEQRTTRLNEQRLMESLARNITEYLHQGEVFRENFTYPLLSGSLYTGMVYMFNMNMIWVVNFCAIWCDGFKTAVEYFSSTAQDDNWACRFTIQRTKVCLICLCPENHLAVALCKLLYIDANRNTKETTEEEHQQYYPQKKEAELQLLDDQFKMIIREAVRNITTMQQNEMNNHNNEMDHHSSPPPPEEELPD